MLARGERPADFARRLLEGEDRALQECVLDALFDRPDLAPGALTMSWLDARLASGSRDDLKLAAAFLRESARAA